jgi:hypothetical protein
MDIGVDDLYVVDFPGTFSSKLKRAVDGRPSGASAGGFITMISASGRARDVRYGHGRAQHLRKHAFFPFCERAQVCACYDVRAR